MCAVPAQSIVEVRLRPGRERSLLRFHPWVMSGALADYAGMQKALPQGGIVKVVSVQRQFLGWGMASPVSQMSVRIWSFREEEPLSAEFIAQRLGKAIARRKFFLQGEDCDSYRLIHGEADGFPGCVIDRYGCWLVAQFLSSGAEYWREVIVDSLRHLLPEIKGIYERSDTDSRCKEGLEERCGLLWGEEPPDKIEIHENGVKFLVDVRRGHKTGFYLDQRVNRSALVCAKGGEVLNCFCYTGGFGLRAVKEGALHVTQVDLSGEALALARENADLNQLPQEKFTYLQADVFQQLRKFRDMGKSFDVVVLDPPKFADSHYQLEKACRGYKDINLLGAKLVRPGGVLLTYSCSGAMMPELFFKVVGDACRDARRQSFVLQTLAQAPDHPLSLDFPEGRYLTGLALLLP